MRCCSAGKTTGSGTTFGRIVVLSSPCVPSSWEPRSRFRTPQVINRGVISLSLTREGKKMCFDISGDRASHVKHVKQTAALLSVFLEMFSSRSLDPQRHLTSFCLFEQLCQTLYVCPQNCYPTVTLCRKVG